MSFVPTRFLKSTPGEYYHIYNRGAKKQNIFEDRADWARLLFGILYAQSPILIKNVNRLAQTFSVDYGFSVPTKDVQEILGQRFVELTAFCLMPNHFHLLVKEKEDHGISRYMHRIADGYTKYVNTRYSMNGCVFQGPYKMVHVRDNRQLLYLSAYIHRNPRELKVWKGKEFEYPWSSLQDYTKANRWGGLLESDIIAEQFSAERDSNYKDFVATSTAKIFEEELETVSLIH